MILSQMQTNKFLAILALATISILNAMAISPYQKAVNNFVSDPTLKHASIGVCVVDLETGKILADTNAEKALVTASTMKIVTTASALEILGKDFHFHTKVYAVGKIDDRGTLHGNLIIQGGGDPTLGSSYFKEHPKFVDSLVVAINATGIRHINGRIIADNSAISCPPVSQYWMLEDIPAGYGTGYHAINFADNRMKISFTRGFNGRFSAETTPEMSWININADVNEIGKSDTTSTLGITSFLDYGSSTLDLSGNTRLKRGQNKFYRWFANPAPDKLLIDSIISAIGEASIPLAYKNYTRNELSDTTLLLEFSSPALPDIVESLMFRSDNLFAEAVLKAIATDAGKAATDYNAIKILSQYWDEKGIDLSGLMMKDGCGLARNGCATPLLLCDILRATYNDRDSLETDFSHLFPVAGRSGTIKSLLRKSKLRGHLALKSGSMDGVQSYAGYFPAENPRYAVAVIVNNFTCKRAELRESIERMFFQMFAAEVAKKGNK